MVFNCSIGLVQRGDTSITMLVVAISIVYSEGLFKISNVATPDLTYYLTMEGVVSYLKQLYFCNKAPFGDSEWGIWVNKTGELTARPPLLSGYGTPFKTTATFEEKMHDSGFFGCIVENHLCMLKDMVNHNK